MEKDKIYKLLWATIEDFVGIWEFHWEVNSLLKHDVLSNKKMAKKVLLFFLDHELIELFYDKWGADQLEKIENSEAREIIKGEKYWLPPDVNDVCVKAGSTVKGEKYYNEEMIGDVRFL
ncbi:MAG: hypothetical protein R6V52_07245 [Bacteroidales bacterium]